jgi:hypothetical protein
MHIFCGLTPAGKVSNRWVRPQAKFIPEINQGSGRTSSKKNLHNIQRSHISPFKEDHEYIVKMPLYVHGILSQPCLSYSEK